MKIGVISDTHDHLPNIRRAVEIFQAEKIDALIHAGDFIAPFALLPWKALELPKFFVFGNNDGERAGLQARAREQGFEIQDRFYCFEFAGRRFLIDHYPLEASTALTKFADRDFIITGHTHKHSLRALEANGALLINPGEACGYVENERLLGVLDPARRSYRAIEIDA